jgi:hypothetical protein
MLLRPRRMLMPSEPSIVGSEGGDKDNTPPAPPALAILASMRKYTVIERDPFCTCVVQCLHANGARG